MNVIQGLKYHPGSKEELLPGFSAEFPYIASHAVPSQYPGEFAPWHWHNSVELFYIESGSLEYTTPSQQIIFPAGSAGFVNSNVLHTTKVLFSSQPTNQFLHIFDPAFLAGQPGSQIEKRYITPVTAAAQLELIPFFPDDAADKAIIEQIVAAFQISKDEFGYELHLRNLLSTLWLSILQKAALLSGEFASNSNSNDRIKMMLVYIYEHYSEKISIRDLASAAHLSERECFRTFHDRLHTTPIEYIKNYRLQMACQLLASGQGSVTEISQCCGFGSSSYFGKVFSDRMHCSPLEYRRTRQDINR